MLLINNHGSYNLNILLQLKLNNILELNKFSFILCKTN